MTGSPHCTGRVKRGEPPKKQLKRHSYADCIEELLRDFEHRCAYSMQHISRANGKLEVDHFDPRLKKEYLQYYTNLFPSSRHCNGSKSNVWPSKWEEEMGLRFLNCCAEIDYGEHIFEDPTTYELLGISPAAVYHIIHCDLNAWHLLDERRERSGIWKFLRSRSVTFTKPIVITGQTEIDLLITQVSKMIPEIPPPPAGYVRAENSFLLKPLTVSV